MHCKGKARQKVYYRFGWRTLQSWRGYTGDVSNTIPDQRLLVMHGICQATVYGGGLYQMYLGRFLSGISIGKYLFVYMVVNEWKQMDAWMTVFYFVKLLKGFMATAVPMYQVGLLKLFHRDNFCVDRTRVTCDLLH